MNNKPYTPMSSEALDEWERLVDCEIQVYLDARQGGQYSLMEDTPQPVIPSK